MANDKEIAELQKYLNDEDYKMLLAFCMEPKEWKEIAKIKMKKDKIFQVLKDLKVINALEFADGKYYTAPFAQELLK